jgi:P4 family phage/plasmid primase-like protien
MPVSKKVILRTESIIKTDKTRQNILSKLWNYIMEHEEKDKLRQTHMWFGYGSNKIMFRIDDNEYDEFVELVANTTVNIMKYNDLEALHITELPLSIGNFNIDLDIQFIKNNTHQNFIEPITIIETLNKIIKKHFILKDNSLSVYYFIKEKPYLDEIKNIYSDGIHISYPNLKLNTTNKNFIIDLFIEEIKKNGDFDELINYLLTEKMEKNKIDIIFNEEINDFTDAVGNIIDISVEKENIINKIFDRGVFNKTKWLMYGSGKEKYQVKDVYRLKYMFDSNCDVIDETEFPDIENLVKILAIRQKHNDETMIYEKYKIKETPITHFDVASQAIKPFKSTENKDNIIIAKKLVKLLKKERAEPYDMWKDVGLCLYGISDTLINEFIEFSKQSDKFDINGSQKFWSDCKKNYNHTHEKRLTIGSLKFWAKQDNPEEYTKFYNDFLNGYSLEDTVKLTELLKNMNIERDHEIALIIKELYGRSFCCSSVKGQNWYHFENHRWNFCDAGYKLNNLISEHFTKYIFAIYKQLSEEHLKNINDENITKKKDKFYNIITKFNKNTYKKTLMAECATTFYQKNFINKLDEEPTLIGFENGVYDLKTKELRDGLPEDRLTFSTGYNYNIEYTLNHPDILELERIIKLIQPVDEVRIFMLCHIASCLVGGNKDQKIVFWIGPGGKNGKSTIQNLISGAFGRYYKYVDNTLITKERGKSNEASPDILELKGVRTIILSELEPGIKIHAGFFKRITGGDPLKGRDLFSSDIIEYIPQFKPILISNILPEFNSINDNAVWRRVCVIDFNQKFVDNPKNKNEHKIDNNLPQKLEKLKGAFMWLLINKYYKIYDEKGLDALTPECVKEATNRAKTETEPYLKFSEDNIVFDENAVMEINTLKTLYNEWHLTYYNKKATKPAGIVDYFIGEGCIKKGKNIIGIKGDLVCGLVDDIMDLQFKSKLDEK